MEDTTANVTDYLNVTEVIFDNMTTLANVTSRPRFFIDISVYILVERIFTFTIIALGVPGNMLLFLVQYKNPRKTTTDYLVMTMAMYEFVCTSINAPIRMLNDFKFLIPDYGNTFYCSISMYLYFFTNFASATTLTAVAIDRCIKTCFPLNTFYNEKRAKWLCGYIFIFCSLMSSPYTTFFYWHDERKRCIHVTPPIILPSDYWGRVMTVAGTIWFIIMFVCYLSITIVLRRRHAKKLSTKKISSSVRGKQADEKEKPEVFVNVAMEPSSAIGPGTDVSMVDGYSVTTEGETQPTPTSETVPAEKNGHTSGGAQKTVKDSMKSKKNQATQRLEQESRNLNKLTVIMFMITALFMATYSINWLLYALGPFAFGFGFLKISFAIPMLNCITNAVIFTLMSSRFRSNAKKILSCKR